MTRVKYHYIKKNQLGVTPGEYHRFAFAVDTCPFATVTFMVRDAFYLSNSNDKIKQILIGQGGTMVTIPLGGDVIYHLPQPGKNLLDIKVVYESGLVKQLQAELFAKVRLQVEQEEVRTSAAMVKYTVIQKTAPFLPAATVTPANYFALKLSTASNFDAWCYPFTSVTSPSGPFNRGAWSQEGFPADVAARSIGWRMRVYSNHPLYSGARYQKPIIVTQGFQPDFGYMAEDFDAFERQLSTTFDETTDEALDPTAETPLLKTLYDNGHEIVLVQYMYPNAAIEDNAWALQSAIWHVSDNCASPATPIRIIGPSMGGLIARYGVQSMRERYSGTLPSISNLALLDAPNRGAVIPMSIQAFLYYFGYYSRDASIDAKRAAVLSPAAKEMLLYYINPRNGYGPETDYGDQTVSDYENPASDHGKFMADINAPSNLQKADDYYKHSAGHFRIRTAAVSNGSGRSEGLGLPKKRLIGNWWAEQEASECPAYTLWCLGVSPDVADIYLYTGWSDNVSLGVFQGDVDGWLAEPGQDRWIFNWSEPVFVETAPGGVRKSYSQLRNEWDNNGEDKFNTDVFNFDAAFNVGHAFVPTFSAIGLRNDLGYSANVTANWHQDFIGQQAALQPKSMFANIYMPEKNQVHAHITHQNKAWFLDEMARTSGPSMAAINLLLMQ